MSSRVSPDRRRTASVAGIGPVSMSTGSEPTTLIACTRASGVSPWVRTADSDATSSAAAPSEIWLETAAVILPPSRSGSSWASFSLLLSGRGPSSAVTSPYGDVTADEGPRPDSSREKLAQLEPLREGGRITAAVSSQISDGAAALLVASESAVRTHGLTPLARVHAMSVVGSDPVLMLTGPIPATDAVLRRSGLTLDDIDYVEINEAFASVVLAWQSETGASQERTNALGGAIALGHPLGATGARLMTTLIHHLRRTGARYGLQTMCEGGGMANATIVERL